MAETTHNIKGQIPIDKNVKFTARSKRLPQYMMPLNSLWPRVENLQPGQLYKILYDKPNTLTKHFIALCPKRTGKTFEEMNIVIIKLISEKGILVLKL